MHLYAGLTRRATKKKHATRPCAFVPYARLLRLTHVTVGALLSSGGPTSSTVVSAPTASISGGVRRDPLALHNAAYEHNTDVLRQLVDEGMFV